LNSLGCQRKILLSGTPIQNDLLEFHALVDFVNPNVLGPVNTFKRVFLDPIMKSRQPSCHDKDHIIGEQRLAELNRMTALFVLRRNAELNKQYLPEKGFCRFICSVIY
jgi:SNF2 family DNA or RNA helicase